MSKLHKLDNVKKEENMTSFFPKMEKESTDKPTPIKMKGISGGTSPKII
ncbi:hypothetical protein BTS2_0099 [Bacillus sp. TS-2]|nr:hypothetical protein BTS2_0099 [Bacillus sp. TS-2]